MTLITVTPLACSACGRVGYIENETGYSDFVCSNMECEHEMNTSDFVLDEGEELRLIAGVLCVRIPA